MKRVYALFCLSIFLCITFAAFAQAPQSFNYQSVARNVNGAVVSNQAVKLRLSITDAASGGNILYRESHSLTTNQFGLVTAAVGDGSVLNGSFAAINWGAGSRYLQVEVDPTGGNTFADMGTAQLLSVPYALYAETSGNGAVGPTGAAGATGPTGAQGVTGATGATGTSGQAGDRYTTTSSTSLSISSGAKTLTVGTGLSYAVGQTVIIANSATNVMTGTVTAYNSTTGAMSVTVTSVTGSGTFTSWTVALNGAPGPAGPTGVGATGPTGATGTTGTFGVTGTTGQTIRHNGTAWVATSNLYNNGTRVGIGTTSPAARLHVADSSVVYSATDDVPTNPGAPPISGEGRRMMWYADKAAFRAGYIDGTQWDKDSIGTYSFAVGYNTVASGYGSIAMGATNFFFPTIATGNFSTAIGCRARAIGNISTAIGYATSAEGVASTAMGQYTFAASFAETTLGSYNTIVPAALSATSWNVNDRLFVVGNGTDNTNRSDALTIFKNGDIKIGNNGNRLTNLKQGRISAGTQSGNNKKSIPITFGTNGFTTAANVKVQVTPQLASGLNDAFLLSVRDITTTGCTVEIYRADAAANTGWGTAFNIVWMAWE